jgi:hypothetical protein
MSNRSAEVGHWAARVRLRRGREAEQG